MSEPAGATLQDAALGRAADTLLTFGIGGVVLAITLLALWKIGAAVGSRALAAFTALFDRQLEQGTKALDQSAQSLKESQAMREELRALTQATRHSDEQNVAALRALQDSVDRGLNHVNHRVDQHEASLREVDRRVGEVDRRVIHLELIRDGAASGVRRIPVAAVHED